MEYEIINMGSGSSGNCYALKKETQTILIECGFTYKELLNKLTQNDIAVTEVVAVVVSHKHKDHSLALHELLERGVRVFAPMECYVGNETDLPNANVIQECEKPIYQVCDWLRVYYFPLSHDVECFGYAFMDTDTKQSLLFITDTALVELPQAIRDIKFNQVMIECNHRKSQLTIMLQNAIDKKNKGEMMKYERQSKYHLSLINCKKMLNQLSQISHSNAIFLLHASKECCNTELCRQEIKKVYNVPTFTMLRDGGLQ